MSRKNYLIMILLLAITYSCDKDCKRGVLVWFYNATEHQVTVESELDTLYMAPEMMHHFETFPVTTIPYKVIIRDPENKIVRYDTVRVNDCGTLNIIIDLDE